MDYDENDFQSENFELVGDENKFPPSLRTFTVPKFNFDDHLRVHLRFDNLADTDVLLDIQGQDNNWIADFSSGTSALEFSSSVDNCSVSRHSNVWSEASSSESVEMLLRSVGEDEMNDTKVTAMEVDTQNVSSGTDPASRQVDNDKTTMGDIIQDGPSAPPDNFQINLSRHVNDASGAQSEVEGMSQIFSNEKSGVALDASSVGEQFHSDKKIVAKQCKMGDDASAISETLCNIQNDEPLGMKVMNTCDWNASHVARGSPGSITCRGNQEHEVTNSTVIKQTEKSVLQLVDIQKLKNQMLRDAKENEQLLQSPEVETQFCSSESTSFLKPTKDSFVLMNEGNVTGFSEKPDRLLEAITYQAQSFSNDAGATSSMQVHEMHPLETERERFMRTDYVDISKEDVPKKLTDHNDKGIGNTFETAAEENVLVSMDSEMQRIEGKYKSSIKINNLGSQTWYPAFLEKSVEPKIMGDVDQSGSKRIVSENATVYESPLSAVLNNDEVEISSSVPEKLHKADESFDVHTYSPDPSYIGTKKSNNDDHVFMKVENSFAGQSFDYVGVTNVSKDKNLEHYGSAGSDLALMGVGQSSLVGQESQEQKQMSSPNLLERVSIYSDVKITGTPSASVLKNKSDAALPVVPVIISDPVVPCSSPPKGIAQDVPGVKVIVLDKRVELHQSQDTSTANVLAWKEESTPSQFSPEFIRSNEKKDKISASSSLTKSEAKISVSSSVTISEGNMNDRPFRDSDSGESSPVSNRSKPKTTLVEHSSSFVESSVVGKTEIQYLGDKPITHEEATAVGGNFVSHHSSIKVKDNPGKSEASSHEKKEMTFGVSAESPSHGEGQLQRETPPSVEKASATPVICGLSTSTLMPGSNAEAQMAAEIGKHNSPESSCGSPTVISCSGHSQEEPEGENANKVKYSTRDSKESTSYEDDRIFTFEIGRGKELPEKEAGSQWKPFPAPVQSSEPSQISKETRGCHSESVEGKHQSMMTKAASGFKTNQATRPSNEKLTTPKRRLAKGTSTRRKSTDSVGKSSSTSSTCVGTVSSGIQLEEKQPYTHTVSNHLKKSGSSIVQSSSLPDLNSSNSASTLFHQPFTDIQQVQLRAQIFVYGSLIQNVPPDETCMQSAFGETDGGRSTWESVWRKSVDRHQNQKSPFNCETPLHFHSAVWTTEQATKCSSTQSKTVSTSCRNVVNAIAPAILNSTPPLPSPLWSVSTHGALPSNLPRGAQLDFNQTMSPLHSYPSSQKPKLNSSMPRLPQNPRLGRWGVSAQSPTLNATIPYSTVPVVEAVQATPVKDSPMPHVANMQFVSPCPLLHTPSSASVSPSTVPHKKTTTAGNDKNASSIQRSRKRKKAAAAEDISENIPFSQSYPEPTSISVPKTLSSSPPGLPISSAEPASNITVPKTLPFVFPGLLSCTPSKFASQTTISANANISPTQYQIIGSNNTDQRVIFSEETCNKSEQAKLQAEDAAAVAASVVSHSQAIWNQLAVQRNSGLVTEVEEKLASAAVAAAAAVSVAKAAAMAAKVASDAALQAKMMADEALDSANTEDLVQNSEIGFDAAKSLASLTPGSILQGKDKMHGSSSVISAVREATRKRVEAASAATKRAENLDAIMKAAELAVEAISQVGTIIAMGDPLPFKLSELIEAGPEGCWKAYRPTSKKLNEANKLPGEECEDLDHRDNHYEQTPCNNRKLQRTATEDGIFHDTHSIHSTENWQGLESGIGVPSKLPNDGHEKYDSLDKQKENVIQKGSVVEVMPDEEGLRGGWFSARVLDVKDNKAHVCYNNILSDGGNDQRKEWISLNSESSGAPNIRIAHSMIATKHDITKKRRREAVGNYVWSVGDRVDAHMRDGWWEGIVTEKSQVDESKLTVHFPVGGDSSLVRAWDLRSSLTWKDGQWIEWSRAKEDTLQPFEGDTPQEKRRKLVGLGSKVDTELDPRGIDKQSSIPLESSGKAVESGPLNLSAKDSIVSVGKNATEANISGVPKMKCSSLLQKEGSRDVIGVPKPGKKRKFMEVSKHYMSDKAVKMSQGNDSLKFAKYLMPQASRPWRNHSTLDSIGKQAGNSKSLEVRSVKSQTKTRSTTAKENSLLTIVSASTGEKNSDGSLSNTRAGFSKENVLEKNLIEVGSLPSTESLVSVSSVQSLPTIPGSKRKSSSAVEAERGVKGRLTPVLDKSVRNEKKPSETHGKAIPDAVEPRRSNRKIQPTSRLLEGLQSSLLISKIPIFSHDKGSKTLHRSSSSRGTTHG